MTVADSLTEDVHIEVENIGGIDETTVSFSPGVTLLVGRNATNRTSFLQAVMAALGSENVSLKADADEGQVEMSLDDATYTRQLTRESKSIVTTGDPYLDDAEKADLFAFLLGSNESRRAVVQETDLRDLIMRPIDTDEITSQIQRLQRERDQLKEELNEITDLKGELPALEEQRADLQAQVENTQEELMAKQKEVDAADRDLDESQEEQAELERKLEDLREARSELDDIRYEMETERESLDALQREQNELKQELAELPETPIGELDELEAELTQFREQKQALKSEINEIQSVVQFNDEILEEPDRDLFAALTDGEGDSDVTDELLPDDTITCWTCGSEVEYDQIESTVTQLRNLSQQKVSELSEIENEIDTVQQRQKQLKQAQRERDRLDDRLTNIDREIEKSQSTIKHLQERRDEIRKRIETLETEVETLESEEYEEILELHKEANQLEYDLGRLESDLEDVTAEITRIEDRIAEEEKIESQIDELDSEITDLRTRIDQIEQGTIENFNKHMETVLKVLNYDNLERIWLERFEREVREGRRKVTQSVFELHVVRSTDSEAVYEDTVDHLSESEREVTGIVFALAGYLAHQVYKDMSFILLDSLEAVDSDRLASLIDYLDEFASYLLVALLPEDASAVDGQCQRIKTI